MIYTMYKFLFFTFFLFIPYSYYYASNTRSRFYISFRILILHFYIQTFIAKCFLLELILLYY